eukprot:COSAG02_NODE_52645_length_306_cov_1.164251_1_plen_82_part_01
MARDGLVKGRDYRAVNKQVWEYFVSRHKGGPSIVRRRVDIYSDAVQQPQSSLAPASSSSSSSSSASSESEYESDSEADSVDE